MGHLEGHTLRYSPRSLTSNMLPTSLWHVCQRHVGVILIFSIEYISP